MDNKFVCANYASIDFSYVHILFWNKYHGKEDIVNSVVRMIEISPSIHSCYSVVTTLEI